MQRNEIFFAGLPRCCPAASAPPSSRAAGEAFLSVATGVVSTCGARTGAAGRFAISAGRDHVLRMASASLRPSGCQKRLTRAPRSIAAAAGSPDSLRLPTDHPGVRSPTQNSRSWREAGCSSSPGNPEIVDRRVLARTARVSSRRSPRRRCIRAPSNGRRSPSETLDRARPPIRIVEPSERRLFLIPLNSSGRPLTPARSRRDL